MKAKEERKMSEVPKQPVTAMDVKELLRSMYGGENKRITDGSYDKSLAVKCKNGTFVGRKTDNIIIYRGIPFVGRQPVGELRRKLHHASPDRRLPSVFQACHRAKRFRQPDEISGGWH